MADLPVEGLNLNELDDAALEEIAGGAYTPEEWMNMTEEERKAAQLRSLKATQAGEPCELD